jgi:hypothetical protein
MFAPTIYQIRRVKDVPRHGNQADSVARPFYGFILKKGIGQSRKYMILAEDVDNFFLDALRERLLESDDFENFLDEEEADQTAQAQLLKDIDEQVSAVKSLMRKIEQQIRSGALTNARLLQAANDEYNGLEVELQRLHTRMGRGYHHQDSRAKTAQLQATHVGCR